VLANVWMAAIAYIARVEKCDEKSKKHSSEKRKKKAAKQALAKAERVQKVSECVLKKRVCIKIETKKARKTWTKHIQNG